VDALDLDTPALYVDLDALERNIARMQEQCRAWGVELEKYARTDSARDLPAAACGPHYYRAPVARVTFDVFAETLSVLRSGDNRVCHVAGRGAGSGADATAPGPSDPG